MVYPGTATSSDVCFREIIMTGQNFMINKHRLENAFPGKNGQNHSNNEFRVVKMRIDKYCLIYLIIILISTITPFSPNFSEFIYSCCQTEQNRRFEINQGKNVHDRTNKCFR